MFENLRPDTLTKKAALLFLSMPVIASLLSGCSKPPGTTAKASPPPEQPALVLPAKPIAQEGLVKLFHNPNIPPVVKDSLKDPVAHTVLKEIFESGITNEPRTYVKNSLDAINPEAGKHVVIVLQYLLNEARLDAVAKNNRLAAAYERQAATLTGVYKERALESALASKRYASQVPAILKLDGDYGKRAHALRGYITQSEFNVTQSTQPFSHVRVDTGALDTSIGPKTLGLLCRTAPGFELYFKSNWEVVQLSSQAATRMVMATR